MPIDRCSGCRRASASRLTILLACLASTTLLVGCASPQGLPDDVSRSASSLQLSHDLRLRQLGDGVWLHTSSKEMPGWGRVPSNGLVVLGHGGALLIDTPWTPAQTRLLVDWIDGAAGSRLVDVVVTHAHEDRTGGVSALPPTARIHALADTVELAAKYGRVFAAADLETYSTRQTAGIRFETFFPGAGHAPDNLVVWLPESHILFGGCFVKAGGATDLGNLSDAEPASWLAAIRRVQERFPEAAIVVPGHGPLGGPEILEHTATLIEAVIVD